MNGRINLSSFLNFCKGLNLFSGLQGLEEPARAIKSNRMIYLFVFLMSALASRSVLNMDQAGRYRKLKKLFRVDRYRHKRYRHCVVSDTSIFRRLLKMGLEQARRINYLVLQAGLACGLIQPIAIVDGTQLGKRLFSCLCFVTRWGDVFMVDCEPIKKRGKELLASQRLVERACDYLGKGIMVLLLADMLYFNERFWNLRAQGYIRQLLIKYTPDKEEAARDYRRIIACFQEMKLLYEKPHKSAAEQAKLLRMGFCCKRGEDRAQQLSYLIYQMRNNSRDNRYQVAQALETTADGQALLPFYVFTTDKSMDAEPMRENGHKRWYIENDGFKGLNAHLQSKRCRSHHDQALANLLLTGMLGYSLIVLFRKEIGYQLRQIYNGVKVTIRFVAQCLFVEPFGSFRPDGI